MNGPQHYTEAERLLAQAHHFTYGDGGAPDVGHALAAEAQAHATLAQVALDVHISGVDVQDDAGTPRVTDWGKAVRKS